MSTPEGEAAKPNYAKTATDKARQQLEKLMKDPSKPVVLPEAPQAKKIRPPREMVKNVQGSSAGAGSGEFHVYKASRRREYERLKLMEDEKTKEDLDAEIERRRKEIEGQAEAKTAKNRAKREKRKAAAKLKGKNKTKTGDEKGATDPDKEKTSGSEDGRPAEDEPFKKRRLIAPVVVQTADQDQGVTEPANFVSSDPRQPVIVTAVANVVIYDED